jgi:putative hydrolase of the HAD superfamily
MIETILFDLGNVLVFHDNEKLFRAMAARFAVSPEDLRGRIDERLWVDINCGRVAEDQIRVELCRRFGASIPEDEFFALWNCHFELNKPILPMVDALVGQAKLLLLSNTNALHFRFLRPQLPILEKFDALVVSHEVGFAKPDARIFEHALRLAGSEPSHTAFFDDLPEYVSAARKVGIRAQLFRDTDDFPRQLHVLGFRVQSGKLFGSQRTPRMSR